MIKKEGADSQASLTKEGLCVTLLLCYTSANCVTLTLKHPAYLQSIHTGVFTCVPWLVLFSALFQLNIAEKAQVLLTTLKMALFCSRVPVSYDSQCVYWHTNILLYRIWQYYWEFSFFQLRYVEYADIIPVIGAVCIQCIRNMRLSWGFYSSLRHTAFWLFLQ